MNSAAAPPDFDPSNITSITVDYETRVTGLDDDTWVEHRALALFISGQSDLASFDLPDNTITAAGTTQLFRSETFTLNSSAIAATSAADWENNLRLAGRGPNNNWASYSSNMKSDATVISFITPSITIEYTPPVPPVASFTADRTTVFEGEQVQFTDTSTNNPTSWLWSITPGEDGVEWNWLGGGGGPTLQDASALFYIAGTYNVTLQATNAGGSDTSAPTTITVEAPEKISTFTDDFSVPGMGKYAQVSGITNDAGRAEATIVTTEYKWARTAEDYDATNSVLYWQQSVAAGQVGREQILAVLRGEQGSGRSGVQVVQNGDYAIVQEIVSDSAVQRGDVTALPLTIWWRYTFGTDTVTVAWSADGLTGWTDVATCAWAPAAQRSRIEFSIGAWQAAGSFSGWFDNINVEAVPPTPGDSTGVWTLWNGTAEVPVFVSVWNGTSEEPLTTELAP